MSGWNPLAIGPFLSMEVLCGLAKWSKVGIIGDRTGQLGENGEYWMGRKDEWSDLKFGAPRWWPPPVSVKD
jgi:hypothetical protein